MKTISMLATEYISHFKKIAKFKFKAWVVGSYVFIEAPIEELQYLGY
jgi:hypothetical protein